MMLSLIAMLQDQLRQPQKTIAETARKIESLRSMRSGAGEAFPFQISELISDEAIHELISDDQVNVLVDMPRSSPMISADPRRFREAIRALLQNAVDATLAQSQRLIGVVVRKIKLDRAELSRLPKHRLNTSNIRTGNFVRISFKDTGHGIAADRLLEIFKFRVSSHNDPTLEENRRGFGLAVGQGIVMESKGFITVESTVGKGSTFSVYLPETDLKFTSGGGLIG